MFWGTFCPRPNGQFLVLGRGVGGGVRMLAGMVVPFLAQCKKKEASNPFTYFVQKISSAEWGGGLPPLTEKISYVVFGGFPKQFVERSESGLGKYMRISANLVRADHFSKWTSHRYLKMF